MTQRLYLAIDGHDGAGKTTLARRLADTLRAAYVRPFSGDTGARLLALAASDPHAANKHARAAVQEASGMTREDVLVFDRHWMTVFTLVPDQLWSSWFPLPKTALCWADLTTTRTRLAERVEQDQFAEEHERYLCLYRELAERFDCTLIRTDVHSEEACLAALVEWALR